ncbi:hypothetical protein ACF1AB_25605 [Streptomyces sp. NPDC014846]|uniref:hypothetical protein n=1 Tax=Streptomyces sp. NPDC014846 TaxID=3364922 RepID=UPI0036FF3D88
MHVDGASNEPGQQSELQVSEVEFLSLQLGDMALGIDTDRVTGQDRLVRRARRERYGVGGDWVDLWPQSRVGEESGRGDTLGKQHQIADER